jgi:hypothetical protein
MKRYSKPGQANASHSYRFNYNMRSELAMSMFTNSILTAIGGYSNGGWQGALSGGIGGFTTAWCLPLAESG